MNKRVQPKQKKVDSHERAVKRNQVIFLVLSALMIIVMIVSQLRF